MHLKILQCCCLHRLAPGRLCENFLSARSFFTIPFLFRLARRREPEHLSGMASKKYLNKESQARHFGSDSGGKESTAAHEKFPELFALKFSMKELNEKKIVKAELQSTSRACGKVP